MRFSSNISQQKNGHPCFLYVKETHLGNVRTVISDAKLIEDNGSTANVIDNDDNFIPEVRSFNDYYPFGMEMPGRKFNPGTYRYGFNGKENDNEVKGTGNSLDFGGRINDPRLGRWLSVDPKTAKYPYCSPYVAFGNNPNVFIDPGGETLKVAAKDKAVINGFKTMVNKAFSGKVIAEVAEDGTTTFHQVPNTELTEYEAAALNELNTVVLASDNVNATLVENDNLKGDDYYNGVIDIGDVGSMGNDDNTLSSKSLLVHFVVEQLDKVKTEKKNGIKITDELDKEREKEGYLSYYDRSHGKALEAEQKTTNLIRKGEVETSSPPDGTYINTEKVKVKTSNGIKNATYKTTYDKNWNNPKQETKIEN